MRRFRKRLYEFANKFFKIRFLFDLIKIICKNNFKFWLTKMNKLVFCVYGEMCNVYNRLREI